MGTRALFSTKIVPPIFTGGASFSPSSLGSDLLAWYDFGDAATITSSGGNVTAVNDKSTNARNLTGVNNPTWDGAKITFNGTNNYLSRTDAFMYANGNCEIHVVMKSAGGGTGKSLVGEGSSASGNQLYQAISVSATLATDDDVYGFIRNDALTTTFANNLGMGVTAWDDVKKLVSWIDTGAEITTLINGVEGTTPRLYTRSGVLTLNRFAIGCLLRTTAANFYVGDAWEIVITDLLDDAERNQLMQYLGTRHGL